LGSSTLRGSATRQQRTSHVKFEVSKFGEGYGSPKCPCIGLDGIEGSVEVEVNGTSTSRPADLGARCEAWSEKADPECQGDEQPAWCKEQWCYVDPCNCELPVPPKHSKLFPEATYQGRLVFYSFATCGAEDKWTEGHHEDACSNFDTEGKCSERFPDCSWKEGHCVAFELNSFCEGYQPEEETWGNKECPCVAIADMGGQIDLKVGSGDLIKYPAETGSKCSTWDKEHHPECTGENPPGWCKERWCYVDPCNCNLPSGQPELATLMEGAVFQGKPVYYSFATCGSKDLWAGEAQCKTRRNEKDCGELGDCMWDGTSCVGWELGALCDAFREEAATQKVLGKLEVPTEGASEEKLEKTPKAEVKADVKAEAESDAHTKEDAEAHASTAGKEAEAKEKSKSAASALRPPAVALAFLLLLAARW